MQAAASGGGRRLHAPVRLHAGPGDDRIGTLAQGVGNDEFELARLVPAEGQAGQVIALDPDLRASKLLGPPMEPAERSRPVAQLLSGKSRAFLSRRCTASFRHLF